MGPEEREVVAVLRTSELSLVGVFAAGASPSDVASPSEGGGEKVEGGGKGGYSGTKGGRSPQGAPLLWVSLAFYIFP
jgi:hypothetical protein